MASKDLPDPHLSGDDQARSCEEGGRRPGMPDAATVVSEETFISPKGRRHRVLKTRQRDSYDDPAEGDDDSRRGDEEVL